jgi:hypothetical protein
VATQSRTKVAITVAIGVGVAVLGGQLLIARAEPIEPFDYFSLLVALAGFGFALYQVVQESKSAELQRRVLKTLLESAESNIARAMDFSIRLDPSQHIDDLLVGILKQERDYIAGLLHTHHRVDLPQRTDSQPTDQIIIELIDGTELVRAALKEITRQARDFVFVVGGRSRDKDYLDCLMARLRRVDLQHRRVVTGDHIRVQLFDHLNELTELKRLNENCQAEIYYLPEDKYGAFTVTRDEVFWALPSSTATQLTTGVRIRSARIASDFRAHVVALCSGEVGKKDLEFFRSICKDCGTRSHVA